MNHLMPILLYFFALTITPGPNNLMVMASGVNYGFKKSLPHYFGICIGFPLMTLIAALGFGLLFSQHQWIRETLKIVGSAYMLYLAYQIVTADTEPSVTTSSKPISFIQACLFQWVNPKAWLMLISTMAICTLANDYIRNAVAISVLYFLMCLPCIGAWLFMGTFLQKILKEKRHRQYFNYAMGLCLVLSIVMIFID